MEDNTNPVYLVMVVAGDNNNKFYRMLPNGDSFTVEFGRIGVGGFQTASYPMYQWSKKYKEKINKGYVDQTHLVANLIVKDKKKKEYIDIENNVIANIVDRLQSMAKQAIKDNYTISSSNVTQKMIDEAQIQITYILGMDNIESFNIALIDLFKIIPRKMSKVANYLAHDITDFTSIVQREQALLDVMKGQVVQQQLEDEDETVDTAIQQITLLDALGLRFSEITDLDKIKIKSALGSCSDKYYQAWKIENTKTQNQFNKFVKDENVQNIKLLWHGSRNENWWSIINSGLVLKPTNAVITGKMFGYGIYFASKARKSLGYTSLSGSYWAKGNSNSAFMSLYSVAYGKPYDAYSFDSMYYNMNYEKLQSLSKGSNCLHAHEGTMLQNDEIIVYKEEQTTIEYLVELR